MANVMGPALVSRYLLPAIVNLTSTLASIGRDCGPESTSYSISKAALNVLTYKQAKARQDLVLLLLDPGWVKTKMGGPGAILAPRTSVKGMLSVITKATAAYAGKFYNYQEKEIL
ncbi:hypothetical protein OG21DRAFT_1508367 [Imleria badia]|nr:hypothetical protein OG21DRAFT_1508367 [Imleria badia]